MKYMTEWKIRPGQTAEAAKRFLAGAANPPEGMTVLARWHKTDLSGGIVIGECSNAQVLYDNAVSWADVIEFHTTPVVSDEEVGPILVKYYG
ncbi:MAG: DUF3303 family protein [Bryobacterales bacterium]|nr:DUF3303 family protein [Acidobacteriota bacterium]MCB9384330.1 DUF3303 family protein [Bryobacterales bacterium]